MLTALRNTKQIPFASKFLSTSLVSFDVGYITLTAVNKFQSHNVVSSQIFSLSALLHQLSYATMTLMAVERMLVLKWPMHYIRLATDVKIKRVTVLLLGCFVLLYCMVRYFLCWIKTTTSAIFSGGGRCSAYVMFYHIVIVTAGQTISTISYIVVLKIVRRQALKDYVTGSFKSLKRVLQIYKSTGMVFIYIVVMTVSSLATYITILLSTVDVVTLEDTKMVFEYVNIFNCMVDPFLYVLWFTECRLACKKLIMKMFCRYSDINEYRVFQIQYAVPTERAH